MKVEWRLFAGAAAFFTVTASAYWFVSYEDAGTTMLGVSVPAFAFVAAWLWFQHRRIEPRPEDRGDAEPSDGAGEVGYFPSSSAWPIVLAAGAVVVANGLVFGPPIAVVGLLLMLAGVFGYAREADTKA
ncbi:MAG TPA: cytochrome c oxidase subunit 4 [Acidimicrobiales bacterium]|nr:cytochrome c oxidase subunit 4 [Acidimicrobiales bacterium]